MNIIPLDWQKLIQQQIKISKELLILIEYDIDIKNFIFELLQELKINKINQQIELKLCWSLLSYPLDFSIEVYLEKKIQKKPDCNILIDCYNNPELIIIVEKILEKHSLSLPVYLN
jgi:hypothetical protein